MRDSIGLVLALAGWLALSIYRHQMSGIIISGALLWLFVFLFPVVVLWFGRSSRLSKRLHSAANWHRWNVVLLYLDKLQNAQRLTRLGIGDAIMARYRALALAGLGRLDEAINGFREVAEKTQMPQWIFHMQLGNIHEVAKLYDKGLEFYRLALEEATDKSIVWIEMGGGIWLGALIAHMKQNNYWFWQKMPSFQRSHFCVFRVFAAVSHIGRIIFQPWIGTCAKPSPDLKNNRQKIIISSNLPFYCVKIIWR